LHTNPARRARLPGRLELPDAECRIVRLRATAEAPAAEPAPGLVLVRVAGAAAGVGAVDSRGRYHEITDRLYSRPSRAAPAHAGVLSRVAGAAVGAVESRDAYCEITDRIRAAPRPLTLEFVEDA